MHSIPSHEYSENLAVDPLGNNEIEPSLNELNEERPSFFNKYILPKDMGFMGYAVLGGSALLAVKGLSDLGKQDYDKYTSLSM